MSTNLSMYRGDSKVVQVTISNLTASGLTGYDYWFTAKLDVGDTDAQAVFQRTTADFTVVTNGDAATPGVITCEILPADTSSLPDYAVSLLYDVQLRDSNGKVTTVQEGKLKVRPDYTRSA